MKISSDSLLLKRIGTIGNVAGISAAATFSITMALASGYIMKGYPEYATATAFTSSLSGAIFGDAISKLTESLSTDWSNINQDIYDDLEAGRIKQD